MINKKLKKEIKNLKIHQGNINRLNAIKIANLEDELKEANELLKLRNKMIKIIQEEESKTWKLQERYEKHLDTDLFYKEYKATKKLYERYSSQWNAISRLMEKLDIKSIN